MKRKISIGLNLLIALLSLAIFAYTFFAEAHLKELAREFVTDKTLAFSEPAVVTLETSMDSPLGKKLVSEEQREKVNGEIALFRSDPPAYVHSLTGLQGGVNPIAEEKLKSSKFAAVRKKIRDYYESVLGELIGDVRIFSGTNIFFGVVALVLVLRAGSERREAFFWLSLIIFAAVVFNSWMYVDGMGFFTIIFKAHVGWWYPVSILITIGWLCYFTGLAALGWWVVPDVIAIGRCNSDSLEN